MDKLTGDLLVTVSGIALSLAGFYIPPVKRWLETLGEWKPGFMAVVLLLITVIYTAAWCQLVWVCIQANWGAALLVWLGALGANQGTYLAVVKPRKKALEQAAINRYWEG